MEYTLQHHGVKGMKWGVRKKNYSKKDIHKEMSDIGIEMDKMRRYENIYDTAPNPNNYNKKRDYKKAYKKWKKDSKEAVKKYEKKWKHLGDRSDHLDKIYDVLKDAGISNDWLKQDIKEITKMLKGNASDVNLDMHPEDLMEAHYNLEKMRKMHLTDSKEYKDLHKNYKKANIF